MKKYLLSMVMLLIMATVCFAADNCETITVADTAIGFTATLISQSGFQANYADCRLDTAQIRFWTNGTDPTTLLGVVLESGDRLYLDKRGDIIRFKAIRTGGTSGVLSCCYN